MTNEAPLSYKITDPAEMAVDKLPPLDRHPGEFVREVILPEYGLSVARLARLIDVNRANLSNVLHGKVYLSRELAYRLGALLDDHLADFLINYQLQWDLAQEADRRAELRQEIERLERPLESA